MFNISFLTFNLSYQRLHSGCVTFWGIHIRAISQERDHNYSHPVLTNQMHATEKKTKMRRLGLKLILGFVLVVFVYFSISQQFKQSKDILQRENLAVEHSTVGSNDADGEPEDSQDVEIQLTEEENSFAYRDLDITTSTSVQGESDFEFAEAQENDSQAEEGNDTDPVPPSEEFEVDDGLEEEGDIADDENVDEHQIEAVEEEDKETLKEDLDNPNYVNQVSDSSRNEEKETKTPSSLSSLFDLTKYLPFGNGNQEPVTKDEEENEPEIDYNYDGEDNDETESREDGIAGDEGQDEVALISSELEHENLSVTEGLQSQEEHPNFNGFDTQEYADGENKTENNIQFQNKADEDITRESSPDTASSLIFERDHSQDKDQEPDASVLLTASKIEPNVLMGIVQKPPVLNLMDVLRSGGLEQFHSDNLTPQVLDDLKRVMTYFNREDVLTRHGYPQINEVSAGDQYIPAPHFPSPTTTDGNGNVEENVKDLNSAGSIDSYLVKPIETTTSHGDIYDNPRPLSDTDFAMLQTKSFKDDNNFPTTTSSTYLDHVTPEADDQAKYSNDLNGDKHLEDNYSDGLIINEEEKNSDDIEPNGNSEEEHKEDESVKYDYYGRLITKHDDDDNDDDDTRFNNNDNAQVQHLQGNNGLTFNNYDEADNDELHQIPIEDKDNTNLSLEETDNSNSDNSTEDIDICPREVKLAKTSHPVTALVAFPGAETTWLKSVLEQLTGVETDNIYSIMARLKSGDAAGVYQMGKKIAIETHAATTKNFDKAIVVISNPYSVEESHKVFRPFSNEWQKSFLWAQTYISWLSSDIPLFVLTYEDLVDSPLTELFKVAAFVDMPGMRMSYKCALEVAKSPPHLIDDVREIAGIYTEDKRRINKNIDDVIEVAKVKHPEILARLGSYKVYSGTN